MTLGGTESCIYLMSTCYQNDQAKTYDALIRPRRIITVTAMNLPRTSTWILTHASGSTSTSTLVTPAFTLTTSTSWLVTSTSRSTCTASSTLFIDSKMCRRYGLSIWNCKDIISFGLHRVTECMASCFPSSWGYRLTAVHGRREKKTVGVKITSTKNVDFEN